MFFTISPNEQHSALVLRLVRRRRNDPFVRFGDDSWKKITKKDYPLMEQWWTVAGQDRWSSHTQHSKNTRRKRNLSDAPTFPCNPSFTSTCSNDKEDSKKLHSEATTLSSKQSSTRVWGPAPPITPPPPHLQLPTIKKPRQSALATAFCDQLECALAEPGAYVVGRAS